MKNSNCLKSFLTIAILLCSVIAYAQYDVMQTADDKSSIDNVPKYLMDQYYKAKVTNNGEEKHKVMAEIQKYLITTNTNQKLIIDDFMPVIEKNPPFNPDWSPTDVTVHTGDVANGGYRQIVLIKGEDTRFYLAVNRRNVSGYHGAISVYSSSNGGITWNYVQGVVSATNYFQSISMLVENRSPNNSILDSTRIFIYFIAAPATNWHFASLAMVSFRRNGSGWFSFTVDSPAPGNKYEDVTVCSNGQYFDVNTDIHCIVHEATNEGVDYGMRHFYSPSWGATHIVSSFNPGGTFFVDMNPSVQFRYDYAPNDEIYIAAERRISSTQYNLMLFTIPEIPQSNYYHEFTLSSNADNKYEKPAITVVQDYYQLPKKICITYTRNGRPKYRGSTNGGTSWLVESGIGPNADFLAGYTSCSSDTNTSGFRYIAMGYVTVDGDSVGVELTGIGFGGLTSNYKINSYNSTVNVAPSTEVARSAGVNYAAISYVGPGPANVYFDSGWLLTGIDPLSNIADKYELRQNYPNPFNPLTKIDFSIPKPGLVKLIVYDLSGREAAVLTDKELGRGTYSIDFNASNLASGVYFYKLVSGDFSQVKKMILVK